MKSIRWLADALHLALLLGLFGGVATALLRGPLDMPKRVAGLALSSANEFALVGLALVIAWGLLENLLRRVRCTARHSAFWAALLLLGPLFAIWLGLMNVIELRVNQLTRLVETRSVVWNALFLVGFLALVGFTATALRRWSNKRLRAPATPPGKGLALLLALYASANLLLPAALYSSPLTPQRASAPRPQDPNTDFSAGPANIQCLRLDELLPAASVSAAATRASGRSFDFADTLAPWRPSDPGSITESSAGEWLTLDVRGGSSAIEIGGLALPAQEVQSIALRMRVDSGNTFQLWWRRAGSENFRDRVGAPLKGQGDWFTYEINTLNLTGWKGTIDGLRLVPTDRDRARIDLDSLHLEYRDVGAGSYQIGSQLRKVVYTHAPSEVRYSLEVPPQGLLTFGLGAASPGTRTRFEVSLSPSDSDSSAIPVEGVVLFEHTLSKKQWRDERVDLSQWSGQQVTLTLTTESEAPGSLSFWSDPIVFARESERPPHVLIYLIDCMRADHTSGEYGYDRDTAPNLAAFAAEGAVFLNAYSQFTSTRPSISSMMTSQYFAAHRVTSGIHDRLSESFDTLPELLRARGYATVAFTDNGNVGPGSNLDQGFAEIFRNGMNLEWNMHDDDLSAVLPWLRDHSFHRERPLYLYLHTVEPHAPYVPPEPYYSQFRAVGPESNERLEELQAKYGEYHLTASNFQVPEEDVEHMVDVYDGLIRLADDRFALVVSALKQVGLYDETLLVVTADHGEVFNEHNNWEHHGAPYQGLTHVPLMVRYPPAIAAGTVVGENVQLVDIAPTILDLIGAPPRADFQGASLLPLIRNPDAPQQRQAYSEGAGKIALVQGDWKFIVEGAPRTITLRDDWQIDVREPKEYSLGKERSVKRTLGKLLPNTFDFMHLARRELYHLPSDPLETTNLAEAERSIADAFEGQIAAWIKVQDAVHAMKVRSSSEVEGLDPKVVAELESLGYTE